MNDFWRVVLSAGVGSLAGLITWYVKDTAAENKRRKQAWIEERTRWLEAAEGVRIHLLAKADRTIETLCLSARELGDEAISQQLAIFQAEAEAISFNHKAPEFVTFPVMAYLWGLVQIARDRTRLEVHRAATKKIKEAAFRVSDIYKTNLELGLVEALQGTHQFEERRADHLKWLAECASVCDFSDAVDIPGAYKTGEGCRPPRRFL